MKNSVPLDATILLVDDTRSNRLTDRTVLEGHFKNIRILEASNGQEALEYIEKETVNIVLLDVVMPGMDGFEVAAEIKRRFPRQNISLIFITADKEHQNFRQKSLSMGAVDYLVRPFDTQLFVSRIELYLALYRQNRMLQKINHEYRNNFDLLNRYVILSKTDLKGIITEVTDAFCEISGYTRAELIGRSHNILRHNDMKDALFKEMWCDIKKGNIWSGEIKNLRKDGSFYWVFAVISPLFDIDGKHIGYISIRQDITKIKAQEAKLIEKEQALKAETEAKKETEAFAYEILNSDQNLIAVTTPSEVLFLNSAMLEFLGLESLSAFLDEYQSLERFFSQNPDFIEEMQYQGSWIDTMLSIPSSRPIHMKALRSRVKHIFNLQIKRLETKEERYVFIFSDVTELEEARSYYKEMAIMDHLTQLYNRFYFVEAMKKTCALAKREHRNICILMLDIDHFKRINDTYGHQVGDEVLKTFAHLMKKRLRESDIVARWGGEEFIVLLPSTTAIEALEVAEYLRQEIEKFPFPVVEHVTCSLGLSQYRDNDTLDGLIKRSDDALYEAKEMGRNRTSVH